MSRGDAESGGEAGPNGQHANQCPQFNARDKRCLLNRRGTNGAFDHASSKLSPRRGQSGLWQADRWSDSVKGGCNAVDLVLGPSEWKPVGRIVAVEKELGQEVRWR